MIDKLIRVYTKYKAEKLLVAAECTEANLRRIHHAALIGVFISIIHISLFVFSPKGINAVLETWRWGIVFSHSIILVLLTAAFNASAYLRKTKKHDTIKRVLQYSVIIVIMAAGIVIVSIDQLATSNITPFIVVCLIMGTIFLVDPVISFLIFTASYVAYYFSIAIASQSIEQLLSNRVNGITAVGIGFALSVILWRLNVRNIKQKQRIIDQQQQLEQANKELERIAYFDVLTGLPNRRYFDEVLKRELALLERKGHESCLVMLDIDDFKGINDQYGHPVGDSILAQLGHLLSKNIRRYDTLCRLGGDEFLVLLPQTTLCEAAAFAERFRKCLAPCPFCFDAVTLRVTASIGVARLSCSRDDTMIKQYADVDKALYQAKQDGRNCVRCAS